MRGSVREGDQDEAELLTSSWNILELGGVAGIASCTRSAYWLDISHDHGEINAPWRAVLRAARRARALGRFARRIRLEDIVFGSEESEIGGKR